jgi:hypothetical protein
MGSHVGYESWVERDWLMLFDSAPKVEAFAHQVATIIAATSQMSADHHHRIGSA